MIESSFIINIFEDIKKQELDVILLRNIDEELPFGLKEGKDIDVLVKPDSSFESFLLDRGYKEIRHPHQNNIFLYNVKPFKFFLGKNNNLLFDLHYCLVCRSLNTGEWIPLDQLIQDSAWENKRYVHGSYFNYTGLGFEDELVTLVTRCVFDKKEFQCGYRNRINEIIGLCDSDKLLERFNLIFFKYSPQLLMKLHNKEFDAICADYIKFKEY